MADINDGGPAFPIAFNAETGDIASGMTLRDYFAAAALQGCLAHECNDLKHPQPIEAYAKHAFRIADAMLAERSKQ